MNTRQYKLALKKEIDKLNKKIDLKILWGVDYKEEAKRHKMLIDKIRNRRKRSLFSRAVQFTSIF